MEKCITVSYLDFIANAADLFMSELNSINKANSFLFLTQAQRNVRFGVLKEIRFFLKKHLREEQNDDFSSKWEWMVLEPVSSERLVQQMTDLQINSFITACQH